MPNVVERITRTTSGAWLRSPVSRSRWGRKKRPDINLWSVREQGWIYQLRTNWITGKLEVYRDETYDNTDYNVTSAVVGPSGYGVDVCRSSDPPYNLTGEAIIYGEITTITFLSDRDFQNLDIYKRDIDGEPSSFRARLALGESYIIEPDISKADGMEAISGIYLLSPGECIGLGDTGSNLAASFNPRLKFSFYASEGGAITGQAEQSKTLTEYSDIGESTTEVVAVPDTGYKFSRWINVAGLKSGDPNLTIEEYSDVKGPNRDKHIIAIFEDE